MRTTVNLPADLHQQALSLARDTSRTLSETVADLMRRALEQSQPLGMSWSPRTGLPVVSVGEIVTGEDVRALDSPDTGV